MIIIVAVLPMKNLPSTSRRSTRGMTLVEVTLVVAVLLGMILVLFVGVSAYKQGANRAICIQNIASVQKALRSYSNLYTLAPGDTVSNLKDAIIGPDKFIEAEPNCRSGGTYTYGGDVIPVAGTAYLGCSISDHVPSSVSGW